MPPAPHRMAGSSLAESGSRTAGIPERSQRRHPGPSGRAAQPFLARVMGLHHLCPPAAILLVSVFVILGSARAEILPAFHPACAYRATHIVVVQTVSPEEGRFRVLETWKGDKQKDDAITVPGLAKIAKGEMVLFLCRRPEPVQSGDEWESANFSDWRSSVAWIDRDEVSVLQQKMRPGPTCVAPLTHYETRARFKELIFFYLRTERQLAAAKAARNTQERVRILAEIVSGNYDRKDEACAELGRCGQAAVPALRLLIRGPPDHAQKYAITAMADAGGDSVLQELDAMLQEELAYWKETAPALKKGWWGDEACGGKPWIRYGNLCALLQAFGKHAYPPARPHIAEIRDFFRAQPVFEEDNRIGRIPDYCDYLFPPEKKIAPGPVDPKGRQP